MISLRVRDRRSPTRYRLGRAATTPWRSESGTPRMAWRGRRRRHKKRPCRSRASRMVEPPHQPHKIDKFQNPTPGAGDGTLVSGSGPKVQPMRRFISPERSWSATCCRCPCREVLFDTLLPDLKSGPDQAAEEVGAKGDDGKQQSPLTSRSLHDCARLVTPEGCCWVREGLQRGRSVV
jgi:hypothetical protein